ncbi:uncharacterized protein LOC129600145 [Paramacrobiotus metropolitanus]|uniref:uncharacterized protein LOC129600145 n=1 Tax=Paramacrobiotus metropolitanus TaxID=2943436 RepID=UPI002445D153|nr:uncharacterized protein LOC129600145 [Paramacrobiotus metropolitanus]
MLNTLRVTFLCILVAGYTVAQPFGQVSEERPGNAQVQRTADAVRDQLESKLGPGQVTLNRVIRYRSRAVDMLAPGGGLTFGMVYYMKIEATPGKYIHASVSTGPSGPKLGAVVTGKLLSDPIEA